MESDADTSQALLEMADEVHRSSRNHNDEVIGIEYYNNLRVLSEHERVVLLEAASTHTGRPLPPGVNRCSDRLCPGVRAEYWHNASVCSPQTPALRVVDTTGTGTDNGNVSWVKTFKWHQTGERTGGSVARLQRLAQKRA